MANDELLKECTAKAQAWLGDGFDEETKAAVKAMLEAEDKTPLIDAFYQNLEFGTGGLRGIMGPGTNRMNKYVVGMATQGFANYINKAFPNITPAVVVGHDCRNNGRMFAETVANIFSANGIKVYLFESLRPTPEISFAIRELGAQAGVNVTASHNPKEYNGYKAYWADGAQVLAPHDTGIIEEVKKVTIDQVKFEPNKDLISIIGGEMDYTYLQAVHEALIDQEVINKQKDLNLAGTTCPLAMETSGHGALKDNYFLDDGAFLAVKLVIALAQAAKNGKKLDSLIEKLPPLVEEGEYRFKIKCEDFKAYGKDVLKEFKARAAAKGYTMPDSYEGVRLSFKSEDVQGWILLRLSLHDPVMPMNIEGGRKGDLAKLIAIAKELTDGFDQLERKFD